MTGRLDGRAWLEILHGGGEDNDDGGGSGGGGGGGFIVTKIDRENQAIGT